MTIALFHWWWDATGLARGQVITGVVSSILAIAAIVYAWRVARRQFSIMDEQTAISKRQMELAEKQDRILEDQKTKRAKLQIQIMSDGIPMHKMYRYDVEIMNDGSNAADGIRWSFLISQKYLKNDYIQVELKDSSKKAGQQHGEYYVDDEYSGYYNIPVLPKQRHELGYLLIHEDVRSEFYLRWYLSCRDGDFSYDAANRYLHSAAPVPAYRPASPASEY